jgi:methylated-DNA-[protein]-cysteine S-methyltransferase
MRERGFRHAAFDSPLGRGFVAVSGGKVVRVSFTASEAAFLAELERDYRRGSVRSERELTPVVRELGEYFAGKRKRFSVRFSLLGGTAFERRIWAELAKIPWGKTKSYGDLARSAGFPGAARAVGQAMSKNPLPIILPCHRVVRSDGSPGGFGMGTRAKVRLLQLEKK